MENYGESYKRELERVQLQTQAPKRALKPTCDVQKTFEKFEQIIEDLQKAGAPISCKPLMQSAPSVYTLTMLIGSADYEVVFFNDSIKVFWRGRDKTPMIYDALSSSRLSKLAHTIIERAVASAVEVEAKPERSLGSKVVKFPQG